MNSSQLHEYFKRIGYSGGQEPTLENLRECQAAHVYSIPFETFDIAMGRPILLTFENLFHKLVTEKRGGYCYEVNALLYFALEALGFKTRLCVAHLTDASGKVVTESVHMVLIVTLQEEWLVDVGWGDGFVEPFCLDTPNDLQEYRIEKEAAGFAFYHKEKKLYYFTTADRPLDFFENRNLYHQTSPHSPFAQELFCCLPTPGGFKMIKGTIYIQKEDGKKTEKTIETDSEYRMLLRSKFGLSLEVNRPVLGCQKL